MAATIAVRPPLSSTLGRPGAKVRIKIIKSRGKSHLPLRKVVGIRLVTQVTPVDLSE